MGNAALDEWTVKGNGFPLSIGMSLGERCLEKVEDETVEVKSGRLGEFAPGDVAIIRNCPNARLNGERVVCESYNAALGEWIVKGDKFPLSVGMSLGAQFLEKLESDAIGSNIKCEY